MSFSLLESGASEVVDFLRKGREKLKDSVKDVATASTGALSSLSASKNTGSSKADPKVLMRGTSVFYGRHLPAGASATILCAFICLLMLLVWFASSIQDCFLAVCSGRTVFCE